MEVVSEDDGFHVTVAGETYPLRLKRSSSQNSLVIEVSDKPVSVTLLEAGSQRVELILDGERLSFKRPAVAIWELQPTSPTVSAQKGQVVAPMPGKVIGVLVKKGEKVRGGDPLLILESMKMEIAVRSDCEAEVVEIQVEEGASVTRGQGLVRLSG